MLPTVLTPDLVQGCNMNLVFYTQTATSKLLKSNVNREILSVACRGHIHWTAPGGHEGATAAVIILDGQSSLSTPSQEAC